MHEAIYSVELGEMSQAVVVNRYSILQRTSSIKIKKNKLNVEDNLPVPDPVPVAET